jgi:hypothetical protein
MTENKKYEITFTKPIEITFFDKNYDGDNRVFKAGDKITATFLGASENNPSFRKFKKGKFIFAIPVYVFDSVRVAPKKRIKMKQVTVVVEIAIAMEVPVGMDLNTIKVMINNNTTWDVNCEHPDANMVDVSDILGITSITEATID